MVNKHFTLYNLQVLLLLVETLYELEFRTGCNFYLSLPSKLNGYFCKSGKIGAKKCKKGSFSRTNSYLPPCSMLSMDLFVCLPFEISELSCDGSDLLWVAMIWLPRKG